jgi:glycosyltransferase involved in cell wall biosynthesis
MKIAIIAPTEIPARRANTMQVMKMAQAFCSLDHQVRLAVPRGRRSPGALPTWDELARHYGLRSESPTDEIPLNWLPANPGLRRYDFSLRAVRWARRWEAELVYTRLPQAAALASNLGMKTILEVHDLPQGFFGPWLFRRFFRGKGAHRLVVITRALANDLKAHFGTPSPDGLGSPHSVSYPPSSRYSLPSMVIAPDGVDLERYQNLPSPSRARLLLNQFPDRFTAGYTGHLYPGRGCDLLLDLAARLPEINFLIVGGEAQDVTRLQNRASAENLENVYLTGFVPNADLPVYQAACEVLLMPYQPRVAASSGGDISRYLSPMKMFEYLACERAIISSDLPVLQEVLNTRNAILLPAHTVDAWVEALQELQRDPQRRAILATQARQDAENYTWTARASKIILDTLPS